MHLPHLRAIAKAPILFLTVCTQSRLPLLANVGAHEVLREIWARSAVQNGWFVGQYMLMPDHVHFFAQSGIGARPLADWMRTWKSISSTRINRARGRIGPLWQADYFDRTLRSLEDYTEKWKYVAQNPVRKGLVTTATDWPYRGIIPIARRK